MVNLSIVRRIKGEDKRLGGRGKRIESGAPG